MKEEEAASGGGVFFLPRTGEKAAGVIEELGDGFDCWRSARGLSHSGSLFVFLASN